MELSTYQQQIIDWAKSEEGNATCNAVAGSGKSTTLKLVALALQESESKPSEIKICVFGKANSTDLIAKFGSAWKESISTLHSAGWTLVKKELGIQNSYDVKVTDQKYKFIAQDLYYLNNKKERQQGSLISSKAIGSESNFKKLIDLARLCNLEPTAINLQSICNHFEIDEIYDFEKVSKAIAHCLKVGEDEAARKIRFDYTDQIWLPMRWKLNQQPWFKPYRFVLVDECQDLNAAQLELVCLLAGEHGRVLAVGDPRQAIMGFAGADSDSYSTITNRLKAKELPLSICYRCPRSHIELVNEIYPNIPIKPAPSAKAGTITQISAAEISDRITTGDLVISRKTAPLVSLCIRLIGKGIPATVKGRAIGDQIKEDLEAIGRLPGFAYKHFYESIVSYFEFKCSAYQGMDNEQQLRENLKDKLEALKVIHQSHPECESIGQLCLEIDELFSDQTSPVTLSTIHRAKGLEAERVFFHRAEDAPMVWRNQQDWQHEQENNLVYVALTRSKSELFIVGNPKWLPKEEEKAAESIPRKDSSHANNTEIAVPSIELQSNDIAKNDNINDNISNNVVIESEKIVTSPIKLQSKAEMSKSKRAIAREALILSPHLSNRQLAENTGLSDWFIGKIRKLLESSGELDPLSERISREGIRINTANIGGHKKSLSQQLVEIAENHTQEEIEAAIAALQELLF